MWKSYFIYLSPLLFWFAFVVVVFAVRIFYCKERSCYFCVSDPSVIFLLKSFSVFFFVVVVDTAHCLISFGIYFFILYFLFAFLLCMLSDDAFIAKLPVFARCCETPAGAVLAEHFRAIWLQRGQLWASRAPKPWHLLLAAPCVTVS